jgi:signal transduction histidine kinase
VWQDHFAFQKVTNSSRDASLPGYGWEPAYHGANFGQASLASGAGASREPSSNDERGQVMSHRAVRLLLVDDNQFDRLAIEHLLDSSPQEFEVVSARDAEEALLAVRSRPFDCVLVDVHLPRQSGVQLMQQAARHLGKSCPPIVVMSASSNRDVGVTALKAGADDFLSKDELSSDVLLKSIMGAIQKRSDAQTRERQELESRVRSLGQLAAGIAHELNNPAAYIRVNLELLEEQIGLAVRGEAPPPSLNDLENHLRLIRECSEGLERMSSIVSELQSFTKSSNSAVEAVSLDDVVNSSARFLRSRMTGAAESRIQLSGTAPVMANRRRLVQVLVNLMSNALDAADAKSPVVRVTTQQTLTHAEVIVEDNGPGIPVHLRERVFEPFFTTKGPGRGSGLGLSLSAEYVAQAGGTLEVDGSPLGGALFRVRIPLSLRRTPTPVPPTPNLRDGAAKATILAVDDEPNIRRAYSRVLGGRYQVYTAGNGKQALDVLRRHKVDAIICDLAMPDMGGRDLLRVLETTRPDVARRVIFCTGGDLGGTAHSTTEEGNLVLSKPVSKFTLEDAIDSLLGSLPSVALHE